MSVETENTASPPKKLKKQDLKVFINLLTDFGFKRVFGIKEVMLDFLNVVLEIPGGIADLTYSNVEIMGLTKDDRKAIFDLICITGNGERIIVEIQNIEQEYYRDRMIVYASQLVQDQNVKGKVGDKDWNYKLYPVYSISIMNFLLGKQKRPNRYLSQWLIKDRDTNEVFSDKLTFICVELPLFDKTLRGVKTALEQWIFLIKHLHELDNIPEKYKTEIFEQLFEMAKIARMSKKEVNSYINSLNELNMIQYEMNRRDAAITTLRSDNTTLRSDNTTLRSDITTLRSDNAAMQAKLAEYERRFGTLNGNNQ